MENRIFECTLEYLNCGSREKATGFAPHSHHAYELVYYLKGSGSTTINGTRYEYFPGICALTEPHHLHDEYHNDETYVIYIVFSYKGDFVNLTDRIFYDTAGNSIRHILEEMKKEFYSQSDYFRMKLDLLTKQLMIELARIFENPRSSENLSFVIKYLNENCNEKIDLKLLAERAGYSYSHFRRLVKEHTGLSPVNYIIGQRLENAKYLLKCTSLPISHISQECGFSSESQFCYLFRRYFDITPKAYRNCI